MDPQQNQNEIPNTVSPDSPTATGGLDATAGAAGSSAVVSPTVQPITADVGAQSVPVAATASVPPAQPRVVSPPTAVTDVGEANTVQSLPQSQPTPPTNAATPQVQPAVVAAPAQPAPPVVTPPQGAPTVGGVAEPSGPYVGGSHGTFGAGGNTNVLQKLLGQRWAKPLVLGVAGVAVVAGGWFGYQSFFNVQPQDYRKAYSAVLNVEEAYRDVTPDYVGPSSTETEIANEVAKIEPAKKEFDAAIAELGKQKAIKRDKELSSLYDELKKKQPDFDNALKVATEAYGKILPALSAFSRESSSGGGAARIQELKVVFAGIGELKEDINKTFVSTMVTLLEKQAVFAAKVEEGRKDYRKYDSAASTGYYETSTQISDAIRDWQSNLETLMDKGELAPSLQKLANKLSDKSLGDM